MVKAWFEKWPYKRHIHCRKIGERLPHGPWSHEPDRLTWQAFGTQCAIMRGPFGAWLGYARLPDQHPWIDKKPSELMHVQVHGGVSYSNSNVRHWWIGFDCSHAYDLMPIMHTAVFRNSFPNMSRLMGDFNRFHYWTFADAKAETERMASQVSVIGFLSGAQDALPSADRLPLIVSASQPLGLA